MRLNRIDLSTFLGNKSLIWCNRKNSRNHRIFVKSSGQLSIGSTTFPMSRSSSPSWRRSWPTLMSLQKAKKTNPLIFTLKCADSSSKWFTFTTSLIIKKWTFTSITAIVSTDGAWYSSTTHWILLALSCKKLTTSSLFKTSANYLKKYGNSRPKRKNNTKMKRTIRREKRKIKKMKRTRRKIKTTRTKRRKRFPLTTG